MAVAKADISMTNRRREMECAVCLDTLRQPKMLSCQHNFCGKCLDGLVQDQTISCPTCRKETTLGPGGVGDLPKNIALISIMSSFCEQCLNRDREVYCDHCGLWMCSTCHNNCKRAQDMASQTKAFMKQLNREASEIHELKSQLTDNVESVKDEIDACERKLIRSIRLGAKRLRDDADQDLTSQMVVLDELDIAVSGLMMKISQFDEQRIKSDVKDTEFASISKRWSDSLKECKSKLSEVNDTTCTIEFVPDEATTSVGRLVGHNTKTFRQPTDISHDPPTKTSTTTTETMETATTALDYEHAQFEHFTLGKEGSGPSEFIGPHQLAISPVTKDLIVLEEKGIQVFNERHQFIWKIDGYFADLCVTDDSLIVMAMSHGLKVFTERGEHVRSIGSQGSGPGQFQHLCGLTVHGRHIYVCDSGNRRIQVVEVDGKFVRQFGSKDVFGGQYPRDVTIHKNGDIYVVDGSGYRSSSRSIDSYSTSSKVRVFTAEGEYKGVLNTGVLQLYGVCGVTTDSVGNIIVSESWTNDIRILTTSGELLRTLGSTGVGPGQLKCPMGLLCSPDGRIVVADTGNHRIQFFSLKNSV